mgnify:FL=1
MRHFGVSLCCRKATYDLYIHIYLRETILGRHVAPDISRTVVMPHFAVAMYTVSSEARQGVCDYAHIHTDSDTYDFLDTHNILKVNKL